MELGFHYYGTYVAARLAKYTHDEAVIIAHAAQYVDDSEGDLLSLFQNYILFDFILYRTCAVEASL